MMNSILQVIIQFGQIKYPQLYSIKISTILPIVYILQDIRGCSLEQILVVKLDTITISELTEWERALELKLTT